MHVEAPVIADTHCDLLQGLVTAVGTENLRHVRRGPARWGQRGLTARWAVEQHHLASAAQPCRGQRRSAHTLT